MDSERKPSAKMHFYVQFSLYACPVRISAKIGLK